jgi:hypothetical protein
MAFSRVCAVIIVVLFAACGLAQNPVPFIESPLSPPLLHVNAPPTTLRITGTGFTTASVVTWNGMPLSTVFVNKRRLTATIPAANLANPGTALITVFNPAARGGTSNAIPFVVSRIQTALNFYAVYYATGMHPSAVVVTDLNNDGRPDLVIANSASYTLSVLIGNGDGTFQPAVRYLIDFGPIYGLAAGDFNGDGNIDIAAAGYATCCYDGVTILPGNGDGTLLPGLSLMPAGALPRSVATADFNGDGNLDLAVANYESGTDPSCSAMVT